MHPLLPINIHLIIAVLIIPIAALAAQDLPPPQNREDFLKELDQVENGSLTLTQKRRAEAITRIQSACGSGSSSIELYLNALDNTKYRENHPGFVEWRQKNQEILHSASYQNAAQLQLRYLLIALQRTEKHDAISQIQDTLAYLSALAELHFLEPPYIAPPVKKGIQPAPPPSDKVIPEAATLIRQPLGNHPVVEWFRISDLLPEGKQFEASAGNFSGIIEKNVKAPLRDAKDIRLPGVWDFQIKAESSAAQAVNSTQKNENFQNTRLPELVFGKLQDTALVGQPNRAAIGMMTLIRSYPNNPDVKEWVEAARSLLKSPASPDSTPLPSANSGQ